MDIRQFDHIAYTDANGRSWSLKIPDRVRRELLATRAIDALGTRLAASQQVTEAALEAVRTASPKTPPTELIAVWSEHNAALIGLLSDLINDGAEAVSAVRQMLYVE